MTNTAFLINRMPVGVYCIQMLLKFGIHCRQRCMLKKKKKCNHSTLEKRTQCFYWQRKPIFPTNIYWSFCCWHNVICGQRKLKAFIKISAFQNCMFWYGFLNESDHISNTWNFGFRKPDDLGIEGMLVSCFFLFYNCLSIITSP